MELRPGFKWTEVGVIPEEWSHTLLADVVLKVGSGVTPTGGERVYGAQGRPFVRSQNVGWGSLHLDDLAYIDEATHQTFPGTELKEGDVLLNITGASIGRSSVADARVATGNVNQHVCLIRVRDDALDPHFLSYYLLSEPGQRQIDSFQAGGNRQGLNFGQIRSFSLPLPPFEEQRFVSDALRAVDEVIESLTRLLAKKRDLKQAAMQQLLTGKTRLPGFSGEWRACTLGEIGECVIGLTYRPSDVVQHGLLVLRASNIQGDRLCFDDNVYVAVEVPQSLLTRAGDILICVRNGSRSLIGKCARIDARAEGLTFGAFMCIYRTRHSQYIHHALRGAHVQRQIQENLGATINQITNKDLRAFEVLLPPDDEQAAIAEVLSHMDTEIEALEARLAKTRALKQGMMQELLTGRIRLV